MSARKNRERAARKARRGRNPVAVLATDLMANDRITARIGEVREVRVTQRVSIKRTFNAPRIEMGEYSPVSTHALESVKGTQGWTDMDNTPEDKRPSHIIRAERKARLELRHNTVPVVEYK